MLFEKAHLNFIIYNSTYISVPKYITCMHLFYLTNFLVAMFSVILTAFICRPVRHVSLNIQPLKGSIRIFPAAYKVQCPFLKGRLLCHNLVLFLLCTRSSFQRLEGFYPNCPFPVFHLPVPSVFQM